MENKRDYATLFFLVFAILIGGYARLFQVLGSDFPLNDGGMFYQMAVDIKANQYHLPDTTSYNDANIPFVYPPLPFFVIALISDVFKVELLDLFRILPGAISIFTIPAFFILSKTILKSKAQVSLSVLIFALMPGAFTWLIMGGGFPRSLGMLFSVLTLVETYKMYTQGKWTHLVGGSIFASLTVLCHPEATVYTLAGALVMFWFFGRNRKGVMRSGLVAGVVLLATSPWWFLVMNRHGLNSFLAAGQTGFHQLDAILRLWAYGFTEEIELTFTAVLSIFGLAILLATKRYFIPAWFLASFLFEPRGSLYGTPLIALTAAISLEMVLSQIGLLEMTKKPGTQGGLDWAERLFGGRVTKLLFAYLLTQLVFSALATPIYLAWGSTVSNDDLKAFTWIRDNTPSDGPWALVTEKKPLTDPVSEWFPAITQRRSLTTAQGYEWVQTTDFVALMTSVLDFQECAHQEIECVWEWEAENDLEITYLYIRKNTISEKGEIIPRKSPLEVSLLESGDYINLYQTDAVSIFQRR